MHPGRLGLSRSLSVPSLDEPSEHDTGTSRRWEDILSARTSTGFPFIMRLQETLDRLRMSAPSHDLDDVQAQAIENYVSESNAYVNDYLAARDNPQPIRRYSPCGPDLILARPHLTLSKSADCYEERARTLRGALDRLPAPAGAILYKGSLRSVELAQALERGTVRRGDSLTSVSFLSASESPFCACRFATGSEGQVPSMGVIFQFPSHRSFKTISSYSSNPVECEALCPPGASFLIADIERVATTTKGHFWLVTLDETAAGMRPDRDLFGRRLVRDLHSIPGRNSDLRLITFPATTKVPSPV
ncbi:hypothetical protein CDL60_04865 [Roseateles noduli]|nr:hypothetical protein CDL60_04865 [Roseateles noduli]